VSLIPSFKGAFALAVLLAVGTLCLTFPNVVNATTSASTGGGCRLQQPQAFLKRTGFVKKGQLSPARHARAVRYRVERYGSVDIEGQDLTALNPERAQSQALGVRFMGLWVNVHKKIAPALRCVEKRIRKTCKKSKDQYQPKALGGFRDANSYRGGEISNHLFGIAIDIDSDRNPCCGCVSPWPDHPACKGTVDSVYERTALPRCWVYAFERYGFYWLGRDPELRDTMHFEFLGDPDRIVVKF
jgi:hypothetical protein